MSKSLFLRFLPGIGWFFIVALLTCLPGKDIPEIGWLEQIQFDKIVHMGLFGVLVFLFALPLFYNKLMLVSNLRIVFLITLFSIAWGLAIEFIQKYWVTGRDFDLLDWAADSFGSLVACWCCSWILKNKNNQPWLKKMLG